MPLNANFLADFSSFLGETVKSITATKEFQTTAAGLGPAIDQSLAHAGQAAGAVGTAAGDASKNAYELGQKIGDSLKDVGHELGELARTTIEEYAAAETQTSRLDAALKSMGLTAPAIAKQYADLSHEFQEMTGFSHEAITAAEAVLTAVGQIKPDQMRETLEATTNLARGMNTDLGPAALLVAKAAASDGEAIGRLKAVLRESLPDHANYQEVLAAIMKQFSGQNAAYIETTAGHIDQLKNSMKDFNEEIGKIFADNLKGILDAFKALPEPIQKAIVTVVGLATVLTPILVSLASFVSLVSSAGAAALWDAIASGVGFAIGALVDLLAAIGPVGWLVLGIGAAAALIYKYWGDIVAGVKWLGAQIADAFTGIVGYAQKLYEGIKVWLSDRLTALIDYVATLPGKIVGAFQWAYNALIGHSIIPDLMTGIGTQFGTLQTVMVDPALASVKSVVTAFGSLATMPSLLGSQSAMFSPWPIMPTLTRNLDSLTPIGMLTPNSAGSQITINMSGMLGTDDPQTRATIADLVSDAVMQGMRGGRLLGTA